MSSDDDGIDRDESLETIFAMRISRERALFYKQLTLLVFIIFGICLGFGLFGGMQYYFCTLKRPGMELMECIRGDYLKERRNYERPPAR